MEQEELLSSLEQELRRGTIVLGVLSKLDKPMYGYNLVEVLADNGLRVDANTLYPLLRRLESQGLLTSSWDTDSTKPRKYYERTKDGTAIYKELKKQWNEISTGMEKLLSGK
jgi:DNA-binding PadR family transcriptional regulator